MTNSSENLPADAPLDEQLVAYLDGELDAETARRIEARLASDANLRRRLQSLERTWDLLDELDVEAMNRPLVQSTLEMVAVAAEHDVAAERAEAPRRQRRRLVAAGGRLLSALLLGYFAVSLALPDPNRQLLRDLPILENLDQYRQAESIEYLRRLRDAQLFVKDKDGAGPARDEPTAADDSPDRRRRQVAEMSLSDKEQLLWAQERFSHLEPAEQQRLRQLFHDLQKEKDGQQLRAIMHRYWDWLETLPSSSYTRAELLDLPPDERIEHVKTQRHEEKARNISRRPGPKDMDKLVQWMREYVAQHEKPLLDSLPAGQRKRLQELDEPARRRGELLHLMQPWQAGSGQRPAILTDADLAALRNRLSPETRSRLESLSPDEQWRRVVEWLRQGVRRPPGFRGGRGPRTKTDEAGDKRLETFFEKELTDQERERLMRLPGDEMQRELLQLFRRIHPGEGAGRRTGHAEPASKSDGKAPDTKK
jgi:hypothetical protein